MEPFREKNIRVFENVSSTITPGDAMVNMNLHLCETFDDLLRVYFKHFQIEGYDLFLSSFFILHVLLTRNNSLISNRASFVLKLIEANKFFLTRIRLIVIKDYHHIFSTDVPWKAFLGDWIPDEITRAFGMEYDPSPDDCCYVLVTLSKIKNSVRLNTERTIKVKDYVFRAIEQLNASDATDLRRFMKSYGTHYIDSYITGNFIYQVSLNTS